MSIESYRGNTHVGDYILYVPNIEHLGVHKKNIWEVIEVQGQNVRIKGLHDGTIFTSKARNCIPMSAIEKYGMLNADNISTKSLPKYLEIMHNKSSRRYDAYDDFKESYGVLWGKNPCAEIKLGDSEECSLPYEETGVEKKIMNTTISGTIDKNSNAAKEAAIVVAGATLNQVVADQLVKQVPRKYKKLLKHPLANVVIANVASFVVQNFVQTNQKARVASDAMLQAAMQDFLRSFNIEQMISEVLNQVDLSAYVDID